MGKRVQLKLADLLDNPKVRVALKSTVLEGQPGHPDPRMAEDKTVSQAHVTLVGNKYLEYTFDVSSYKGVVELSMDYNGWSDGFQTKTDFLMGLDVPYTVM